jgi:hypothetical protein
MNLMLYDYDESGVYVGCSPAYCCEITGDPIFRINSTEKKPPVVELPSHAIYDGEKWLVWTPSPEPVQSIDEKRKTMVLRRDALKLKLIDKGLFNGVNYKIMELPDDRKIKILWQDAPDFHRLDPILIEFLSSQMDFSDEQIDDLFV